MTTTASSHMATTEDVHLTDTSDFTDGQCKYSSLGPEDYPSATVNPDYVGNIPPAFTVYGVTLIIIIGIIGNLVIIINFMKHKSLRLPQNLFIVNLAVADLAFLLLAVTSVINIVNGGEMLHGETLCSVFSYLLDLIACETLISFGLLALSRYIIVVHPAQKQWFRWWICAIICISSWVYSLIFSVIDTHIRGRVYTKQIWMCMVDLSVGVTANIFGFVCSMGLSTVVMTYCYICIYRKFRKSNAAVTAEVSNRNEIIAAKRRKEQIRLAIQLLVIYGIYNICWGGFALVELILDPGGNFPAWLYSILLMCMTFNSAVNVFVYLFYNRTFRVACFRYFRSKIAPQINVGMYLTHQPPNTTRTSANINVSSV